MGSVLSQQVAPSARTVLALGVALGVGAGSILAALYGPEHVAGGVCTLAILAAFGVVGSCVLDGVRHRETTGQHRALIQRSIRDALTGQWLAMFATELAAIARSEQVKRGHEASFDADGRFYTHHPASKCAGEACAIHHPSDHQLAGAPLLASDRPLMVRVCEHGYRHPDPDSLAYLLAYVDPTNSRSWETHDCCPSRCCGQWWQPRDSTGAAVVDSGDVVTPGGRTLTEADFDALADEAERGYDVSKIKTRLVDAAAVAETLDRRPPPYVPPVAPA